MADYNFGDFTDFSGSGGTTYNFDTGNITDGFSSTGSSSGGGGFDWGQAISSGADILGGIFDYNSGKDAAEKMAETYGEIAANAKVDAQTASGMADPYAQYRPGAAQQLTGILSGDIDFRTDPGYQFRLNEAMREVERGASARGLNRSSNVLNAMNQRAQDVASGEYNNIINRLTGLAGATPQNAIAGGQTYGNLMGNVYSAQLGQAMNQGQAEGGMGSLISTIGGVAGSLFGGPAGGSIGSSLGSLF